MNTQKSKKILTVFLFIISLNIFAQGSAFDIGFNKGFEETCCTQGYCDYKNYGDYKKCNRAISNGIYDIDYREGYRCGTLQATEFIEELKKNNENLTKIKVTEREAVNQNTIGNPDHLNVDIYKEVQNQDFEFKKPIDYGHPASIDLFNNDIIVPRNYYYNPAEYQRVFIENKTTSLIKRDEKIEKDKKEQKLKETKINKKLIEKNKNYQINELNENGWYECYIEFNSRYSDGKKYETLEKRFVYIENNEIKYWLGKYDMIFKVSYFYKKGTNTFDLMIDMTKDITDKTIITKDIYFIDNIKYPITPFYTTPNILSVYTKRNIPAKGILFSIRNEDGSEKNVNFIDNKWNKNQAPNYWDYENVAKFTLPKGKYYYYAYSYSGNEFWEGEITIENSYTKIELK
jgi:hypothetical protein